MSRLEKLSDELNKKVTKLKIGNATCIKATTRDVAIGTSLGFVVIFNMEQQMKGMLGNVSLTEHGSVSCIAVSPSGEWLLAGYSSGVVLVWELKTAALIRKITDAFGSPVENMSFLRDKQRFIASDSKGLVKLFTLTRLFFKYILDVILLTEKSDNPVLQITALPPPSMQCIYSDHCFIALVNKSKVCTKTRKIFLLAIWSNSHLKF